MLWWWTMLDGFQFKPTRTIQWMEFPCLPMMLIDLMMPKIHLRMIHKMLRELMNTFKNWTSNNFTWPWYVTMKLLMKEFKLLRDDLVSGLQEWQVSTSMLSIIWKLNQELPEKKDLSIQHLIWLLIWFTLFYSVVPMLEHSIISSLLKKWTEIMISLSSK